MKKFLMAGFVAILTLTLLISGILNAFVFDRELISDTKQELLSYASVISKEFDPLQDANIQAKSFAGEIENVRITVIAADGTVLGDSAADFKYMENHLDRTEIIQAGLTGKGTSVRNSETLGKKLVYSAVQTSGGYFIRATKEVSGVFESLKSIIPAMILVIFIALLLSSILTSKFTNGFITPIAEMNDSLMSVKDGGNVLDPKAYRFAELEDMAVKINSISLNLSKYIATIRHEKDKLNYILDNVGEGFLLLDEKKNVLLINDAACGYLDCSKNIIGENILYATRNYDFIQHADRALSEKRKLSIDLVLGGKTIETVFTYAGEDSGVEAALIITMADVTESRNSVKVRREFFSNASHELKTPITSIKGSAELLCSGLPISGSQSKELLERIGLESERMNMLINDIIMISRMESGELSGERESVDISSVINESVKELETLAEQENVTIRSDIRPVTVHANRKDIRGLVSNL
ncbi:MAG: histidine kinase dimerization/phospho-acceptor domain-containing protein, partial [Oscillospiraceae bacterium]|nr:histidine kinase dimerization/phospho-acceptor domain-containing protein [Oscillospiraceae bacterium]